MRNTTHVVAAIAMLGLLSACERPAAKPAVDLAAEQHAVRAADSAFLAAATTHNTDAGVNAFAPEGAMYPPGQPAVVGHDAIRKYIGDAFATPGFSVTWTTESVVVARSGDVAYSLGGSRYTFPGQKKATIDTSYGKGVTLWRKDSTSGRWLVVADFWNDTPAPAAK